MERTRIGTDFNILDLVEHNIGATTVVLDLIKGSDTLLALKLDDMNIRGVQIWYGYDLYCGGDISLFKKCVSEANKDMVESINIQVAKDFKDGRGYPYKAVTTGASYLDKKPVMTLQEINLYAGMDLKVHPSLGEERF